MGAQMLTCRLLSWGASLLSSVRSAADSCASNSVPSSAFRSATCADRHVSRLGLVSSAPLLRLFKGNTRTRMALSQAALSLI